MTPYSSFAAEFGELSREAFLEAVQVPYLVGRLDPEDSSSDRLGNLTLSVRPGQIVPDPGSELALLAVDPQSKSNPYGAMVTIGRAANNDVVLPDPRVSKFHSYIGQVDEQWLLYDADSCNGTRGNGEAVAARTGLPIDSGTCISFGGAVELVFLSPEELYDYLHLSHLARAAS